MDATIKQALALCVDKNMPFACYVLPGEEHVSFYSNPDVEKMAKSGVEQMPNDCAFFFNDFWKTQAYPFYLIPQLDASRTIEYLNARDGLSQGLKPYVSSTSKDEYCRGVNAVIARLNRDGGKTVISRVTCECRRNRKWSGVVEDYFSACPKCFRFCFYHPAAGFWLGATPEILLDYDKASGCIHTMALAGTRSRMLDHEEWDSKNVEEHNYVTDYIVKTLSDLGIEAKVSCAHNLMYGDIEHLCHLISGRSVDVSPIKIVNALSPTPALSGYPVADAMKDIRQTEHHPRYFYGGYVGIVNAGNLKSFVNIRCVHFDKDSYCLYGGGGITAQSIAEDEWHEAESKMKILKNIIDAN